MDRNGVILTTAGLAALLGWPTWKVRRLLKATGAASRRGGRYVTTRERLLAALPEAFEALGHGELEDDGAAGCASCDELRAALLERDRQIGELVRRLGRRTAP